MTVLLIIAIVLICEIIIGFLFAVIAQVFYKKSNINFKSLLKGFAERMFLMLFIYNDLAQALTFFSALKLATRLKHQETGTDIEKFNDYYLVGNLVSVSVALFYVFVLNHTAAIEMFLKLLLKR